MLIAAHGNSLRGIVKHLEGKKPTGDVYFLFDIITTGIILFGSYCATNAHDAMST